MPKPKFKDNKLKRSTSLTDLFLPLKINNKKRYDSAKKDSGKPRKKLKKFRKKYPPRKSKK